MANLGHPHVAQVVSNSKDGQTITVSNKALVKRRTDRPKPRRNEHDGLE